MLAAAVLDAPAERPFGQVVLAQPLVASGSEPSPTSPLCHGRPGHTLMPGSLALDWRGDPMLPGGARVLAAVALVAEAWQGAGVQALR